MLSFTFSISTYLLHTVHLDVTLFLSLQMENESNYSDGSGRQTEEEDVSAVADRHRAQQTETRRHAYQRIASPPEGRAYQASNQSQDLDEVHDDDLDRVNNQPVGGESYGYGVSGGGYRGYGRLDRQVSMPVDLATTRASSTDFQGFSRASGRQGAPSPVPFRGMTPGGGVSFSTPMAPAASGPSQSVSASGQFVTFQTQPPTRKVDDGNGLSFSTGRGASAANAMASGMGSGSSILDRTAYLSARRSTILSKALSAGLQQQPRGSGGV